MEMIETADLILYYSKTDKYVNEMLKYLNEKVLNIKDFFNIKKIDSKPEIILLKNKTVFDELFKKMHGFEADDYSVGYVKDKIYCLSFNAYNSTSHKDESIEFFYNIIVHELTHFYLNSVSKNKPMKYLNEGISLYFGNQYYLKNKNKINCSLNDLLEEKNINYYDYYLIICYLIGNYDHTYLLELLLDSDVAYKNTSKIYNECILYYDGGN